DHQRDLRVHSKGVALVDDLVAELEQTRHVARAVLVIECHESKVAPRRVGFLQRGGGRDGIALALMCELLPLACIEVDVASGPSPRYELKELCTDESRRSDDASSHCQASSVVVPYP